MAVKNGEFSFRTSTGQTCLDSIDWCPWRGTFPASSLIVLADGEETLSVCLGLSKVAILLLNFILCRGKNREVSLLGYRDV